LRPLVQAFYHLIGIKSDQSVKEIIPYWDKETSKCLWTDEQVKPDDKLAHLLTTGDSIMPAVEYFIEDVLESRPKEVCTEESLEWHNHIFALCALIAEMKAQVVYLQ
jgi:hypothetical protein